MLTPPRTHWTLPTHTFKVNLQLKLLCAYAHDTYKMRASRDSGATSFATRRMLHGTVHEHTSGGSLSELSPSARFQLVMVNRAIALPRVTLQTKLLFATRYSLSRQLVK